MQTINLELKTTKLPQSEGWFQWYQRGFQVGYSTGNEIWYSGLVLVAKAHGIGGWLPDGVTDEAERLCVHPQHKDGPRMAIGGSVVYWVPAFNPAELFTQDEKEATYPDPYKDDLTDIESQLNKWFSDLNERSSLWDICEDGMTRRGKALQRYRVNQIMDMVRKNRQVS